MRKIVHLDFNYFFVQVEENLNPNLKGKPLAVGSVTSRGVISTSNYLARSFGIKSGMAVSEARRLCKDLLILEGSYRQYSKISNRIFSYLRGLFPLVEQMGIDEGFIDVTDYLSDKISDYDSLRDLQFAIFNKFSIKCSIGLSFTKFLAKMASDMEKPLGLTILTKENYKEKLAKLPIKDFFGIGKKTYPRLEKLNIKTIGDLVYCQDMNLIKSLGNIYTYCLECFNGLTSDIVNIESSLPKSCSASRTFSNDTNDYEEIKACLLEQARQVSEELKSYDLVGKTVVLTLRDSNFETHSKRITVNNPTNDVDEIFSYGMKIFDSFAKEGVLLRLVGIGVDNLIKKGQKYIEKTDFVQNNIFDNSPKEPNFCTIDDIQIVDNSKKTVDELVEMFNNQLSSPILFKGNKLNKKTE